MRNLRKQAGDTIIEVLIVIMVLSSVLGGAFITINRSTTNIRQSQERVEATKVAEGQLESLKSAAGSTTIIPTSGYFCMKDGAIISPAFTIGVLPTLDNDQLGTYVPGCIGSGNNSRYHIAIEIPSANTYLVHIRWAKYNSAGNEEVTFTYKVYQ